MINSDHDSQQRWFARRIPVLIGCLIAVLAVLSLAFLPRALDPYSGVSGSWEFQWTHALSDSTELVMRLKDDELREKWLRVISRHRADYRLRDFRVTFLQGGRAVWTDTGGGGERFGASWSASHGGIDLTVDGEGNGSIPKNCGFNWHRERLFLVMDPDDLLLPLRRMTVPAE
jgi:hypothetical protein